MKSVVNLTIPFVITEIDQVLASYPDRHCQQAFANPDLYQELIAYVLTRIQCVYQAIEEGEEIANPVETMFNSTGTYSYPELIHQGIRHILRHHEALKDLQVPEEGNAYLTACHWFG